MAESDVLPTLDWRDRNVVTGVDDQGSCGACYAFAAVGTAESALAIMGYELIELSKQQLIDCPDFNTYALMGCYGGWYTNAWAYIRDFGLESEEEYPYSSRDGNATECQFRIRGWKAYIDSYVHVEPDT